MDSKSIPLPGKRNGFSASWILSLLRGGLHLIETLLSAFVALFTSLIFLLVNQKQREFDNWENQRKEK